MWLIQNGWTDERKDIYNYMLTAIDTLGDVSGFDAAYMFAIILRQFTVMGTMRHNEELEELLIRAEKALVNAVSQSQKHDGKQTTLHFW